MFRAAEAALFGPVFGFGASIADVTAADGATGRLDAVRRAAAGLGGKPSTLILSLCRANEGRTLDALRRASARAAGAAERHCDRLALSRHDGPRMLRDACRMLRSRGLPSA